MLVPFFVVGPVTVVQLFPVTVPDASQRPRILGEDLVQ